MAERRAYRKGVQRDPGRGAARVVVRPSGRCRRRAGERRPQGPTVASRRLQGVEAVVTTANAIGRGGAGTVDRVDVEGNASLIDAAEAAGVRRFVFTSVLGASADSPVPFTRAKGLAERRLEKSAMTWTILQPNVFMDTSVPVVVGSPALAGQPVTLVGEGRRRHSMVAMDDVASYAVVALGHEEAAKRRLPIGGPDPISCSDVVATFEQVLRREVPVRTVPLGAPVPGLPDANNGLFQALETYGSPVDMTELAATFGVPPTDIEAFVRAFVSQATGDPVAPTSAVSTR